MPLMDYFFGIDNNPKWNASQKERVRASLVEQLDTPFDRLPKVFLDFESYYDTKIKYGLGSMTVEEYVRDPRFEVSMCTFVIPEENESYVVVNHNDAVFKELQALRLNECAVVAHNNMFDGFVLTDYYGIEAREYICTMQMHRIQTNPILANNLKELAQRFGLPAKLDAIGMMDGKRLADYSQQELREAQEYALRDGELLPPLYGLVRGRYQEMDMEVISDTLRANAVCQILLDEPMLKVYAQRLQEERDDLFTRAGRPWNMTKEETLTLVGSNPKIQKFLAQEGYQVRTKLNPKGKETLALAKTDQGFLDLREEARNAGDMEIDLILQARLEAKSTIHLSRAKKLIEMSHRGQMPFSLKPFGATTPRWTGSGGINPQNFPKRGGDKTLRRGLKAPKGWSIVACDLSQIEARRMADHADQRDLLEQFRTGEDPYSIFATDIYGYEVSKHNGRTKERNVGKEGILSLQYGSWVPSFYDRLTTAYQLDISYEFCEHAVKFYRNKHVNIVNFWKQCDTALKVIVHGQPGDKYRFGKLMDYVAVPGGLYLPDGWFIRYDDIRVDGEDAFGRASMTYFDREKMKRRRIHRGIVANNVTQGSSARIIQYQMSHIRKEGIFWAGTVHDEIIYLVPNSELEDQCHVIKQGMLLVPEWAKDTPIDNELDVGQNYGDLFELKDWLAGGCNQENTEAIIAERKKQEVSL